LRRQIPLHIIVIEFHRHDLTRLELANARLRGAGNSLPHTALVTARISLGRRERPFGTIPDLIFPLPLVPFCGVEEELQSLDLRGRGSHRSSNGYFVQFMTLQDTECEEMHSIFRVSHWHQLMFLRAITCHLDKVPREGDFSNPIHPR
jgi:hypothetical protein